MKWFMNQFYTVVVGMYEAIMKFAGITNQVGDAQVAAARSGNLELQKALAGKKDNVSGHAALLATSMGQEVTKALVPGKAGDTTRINADTNQRIADDENVSAPLRAKAKADAEAQRKEAATEDAKQKFVQDQLDSKYSGDDLQSKYGGDQNKARADVMGKMSLDEQTKLLGDFAKQFPAKPLDDMATAATKKGSIYTHDETVSGSIEALGDMGLDVWVQNWPASIADRPEVAAPAAMDAGEGIDPDLLEDQVEKEEAAVGSLAEIEKVLKFKGVRLNKNMIDTDLKKMTEEATLDAMRVGLLEYAMYKDKKPEELAAMLAGADPKTFGKGLLERAIKPGNAAGGMVTGIEGGEAVVAAPGEGLVSIGKGERILPANAAGTMGGTTSAVTVTLELVGDLKQLVRAVAQDEIVRHAAASNTR